MIYEITNLYFLSEDCSHAGTSSGYSTRNSTQANQGNFWTGNIAIKSAGIQFHMTELISIFLLI